ncbi:hypothetical protein U9M48_025674 [Paspalum notatum var. saurae]|uniref:Uncharacterized protein n=1 Tax=Paspalum notatum var. saurae TaxID=547442 RepID=A0AAQ3TQX0_PASNO
MEKNLIEALRLSYDYVPFTGGSMAVVFPWTVWHGVENQCMQPEQQRVAAAIHNPACRRRTGDERGRMKLLLKLALHASRDLKIELVAGVSAGLDWSPCLTLLLLHASRPERRDRGSSCVPRRTTGDLRSALLPRCGTLFGEQEKAAIFSLKETIAGDLQDSIGAGQYTESVIPKGAYNLGRNHRRHGQGVDMVWRATFGASGDWRNKQGRKELLGRSGGG